MGKERERKVIELQKMESLTPRWRWAGEVGAECTPLPSPPYMGHFTLPRVHYPVLCPCVLAQLFTMTQSPSTLLHSFLASRCIYPASPGPPSSLLWNLPRFLKTEAAPPSSVHPQPLGWPQPSHLWLQLACKCLSPILDSELLKDRDSFIFLCIYSR